MAHFAKINSNNIVLEVIVVNNETIDYLPFPDSEPVGVKFLHDLYQDEANWKQTSYNGNFRKHYAGIGYTYDSAIDAFVSPQPYPSWTFNPTTADWDPPIPMPTDGHRYVWNETTQSWEQLQP